MKSVFVSSNESLNSTSESKKEQEGEESNESSQAFEQEHGVRYTYDQIEFWIYTLVAICKST